MLKQRIITACIIIPIVLLVLFFLPPPAFCVLTGLVTLYSAWEWSNLMELNSLKARIAYLILTALIVVWVLFLPISYILICTGIWWLFATTLIMLYPRASGWWGKSIVLRGLMGFLVLTPCWVALNYIRNQGDGVYDLLFLFVLIWGADSCAYFTGKKWGRDHLAPRVSPGKTWQGLWGAIVCSIIITVIALLLSDVPLSIWPLIVLLALITVLFSVVGDLFESMLKRQAGLKDSSHLLPGHGGLLDRIDSLTAAAPIFALGSFVLGTYFG